MIYENVYVYINVCVHPIVLGYFIIWRGEVFNGMITVELNISYYKGAEYRANLNVNCA